MLSRGGFQQLPWEGAGGWGRFPLRTWDVLVLVFLEVTIQVGLLAKAAIAQVAFEGLLFVVDVTHMPLQVGGYAE